jgi:sugar phosphate isomerase/epimerase
MRLGIGSYAFAWSIGVPGHVPPRPMTAFDLVDMAAELGVRVVQICDNLPLHLLAEPEVDRLAGRAADRGIRVEVGTRGIQPEHLRQYLGLAVRLRSPILRVVVDTADHRPTHDEIVATLRPTLGELSDAGVCLAIENHDRFTARQFCEIVQRLSSPAVGICLDTVNSFGAMEGPEMVVAALAPWVVSLHLKDFQIRRADHQMGFVVGGRPAGQGRLNVPWLLEQLRAAGRDPNAILEQWPPPEATIDQTIAKEKAWARQSVTYLRTLISD